eukprot:CAMPEP_0178629206 /NCGR_PEP_ID=MMETSP0698-20121128/9827_1 /TAXON_ID=265572 /ORGANISM="Extubocellulus spinifer, Strain CCMP396" /LENGTH=538 /DNA_ID=CAMNT_0020268499 /DNA_START=102 /DNA_END=1716 /DNA_ORIENTATION=+
MDTTPTNTSPPSSSNCSLSLPTEVWTEHVLHFLGIRELLGVCSASKSIKSALTHELVFKATLSCGGYPVTSTTRVMTLVERRINHLPSPMRLLRVANGRRCERLASCCSARGPVPAGRRTANPDWGVFMCDTCVKTYVTRHRTNNLVVWSKSYVDRCGEAVGPPKRGGNRIITTSRTYVAPNAVTDEARRTVNAYKRLKEPVDEAAAAKRKRDDELSMAQQAKKARKVDEIVEAIYENLKDKEWADIALAEDEEGRFLSPIVSCNMYTLKKAPSKVKKAQIDQISNDIAACFDLFYREKLHDLSWLKNHPCKKDRPFPDEFSSYEDAMKDHMVEEAMHELSPRDIYWHHNADYTMVSLVRDGQKLEAIGRLSKWRRSFCGYALAGSIPLHPAADHYERSMTIQSLFHRLVDGSFGNRDASSWKMEFERITKVYRVCLMEKGRYCSLDWIDDEDKKRRMRRDRALVRRMNDVLFQEMGCYHPFQSDGHTLLRHLLFDNDGSGDFPALLAFQKKRMGRGGKEMPKESGQPDIRGFFAKKY